MKRTKKVSTATKGKHLKKTNTSKSKKPVVSLEDQRLLQLLQVNQIELAHQNHELRMMEQELQASRNNYLNLFDFAPIPYFVLNRDSTIKEVNFRASKIIKIDRNKLVGKHFFANIPPDEKENVKTFIKTIFNAAVKHSCKSKVITGDKLVIRVRLEGVMLENMLEPDQLCMIALIDLRGGGGNKLKKLPA